MKLLSKAVALLSATLSLALLCACSSYVKLTTVRPAEVSELVVESLSDSRIVNLPTSDTADLKNDLILQLEEPYDAESSCSDTDSHLYRVRLYIGDTLDTEVIINTDGSVCRGGKRYVASDKAVKPVNLADWNALFDTAPAGEAQNQQPPTPEATPDTGATASGETSFDSGSAVVIAASGMPSGLPEGAVTGDCYAVEEALPWSYYISEVSIDGKCYVALWRDTPQGETQCLCRIEQTEAENNLYYDISYDGGAEQSGGRFLYFTITDALNYHRSLWIFDTETLYFNRMYDVPCSNMVIPADAPYDYEGLGWVVYEHYLIPVDLDEGAEYTAEVIDLSEYYDPLGESLFYDIGDWGTHKYVQLADLGDNVFLIDSVTAQPPFEQISVSHQIDYTTLEFE